MLCGSRFPSNTWHWIESNETLQVLFCREGTIFPVNEQAVLHAAIYFNDPFEFVPAKSRELSDRDMRSHMKTRKHREVIRQALTEIGVYTVANFISYLVRFPFRGTISNPKSRFQSASNDIQSRIAELLSKQLVVCSFAEQATNLLMLVPLCRLACGIVLEYNLESKDLPRCTLEPVTYSEKSRLCRTTILCHNRTIWNGTKQVDSYQAIDWKYEMNAGQLCLSRDAKLKFARKESTTILRLLRGKSAACPWREGYKRDWICDSYRLASKTGMYLKRASLIGNQYALELADAIWRAFDLFRCKNHITSRWTRRLSW